MKHAIHLPLLAFLLVASCTPPSSDPNTKPPGAPIQTKGTGTVQFARLEVGPLKANCYIVWDRSTKKGILIDPGDEADRILEKVESLGVKVTAIYATHGHFDHISAVAALKEKLNVPFYIHSGDNFFLSRAPAMAQMMKMSTVREPTADGALKDGDAVEVGSAVGLVIHTPGHSPGGVCFLFGKTLFSGDTLFQSSIGRTDLDKASRRDLMDSIKGRLLTLPTETDVLPGHGPGTTIGQEMKFNPFLKGKHF